MKRKRKVSSSQGKILRRSTIIVYLNSFDFIFFIFIFLDLISFFSISFIFLDDEEIYDYDYIIL